ncbi:hypothetical protein [Acinetobacter sp. P1(2025)]|uniref:hypothetical protein n=1 Tax=Acinetobacter sp. P1(2025) TaxID=3446120 RepID=UPI003F52BEE3
MYINQLNAVKNAFAENKVFALDSNVSSHLFNKGKSVIEVSKSFVVVDQDQNKIVCRAVCKFPFTRNELGEVTSFQNNAQFIQNPILTTDYPYALQITLEGMSVEFGLFIDKSLAEIKAHIESFLDYENSFYIAMDYLNQLNLKKVA